MALYYEITKNTTSQLTNGISMRYISTFLAGQTMLAGILLAAAFVSIGCGAPPSPSSSTGDATTMSPSIEELSKPVITVAKLSLRGYAIVAARLGEKLLTLEPPAIRILGVVLVFTSVGAEVAVEYLDDELERRAIREAISDEMRIQIEERGSVTFILENGQEESVSLGKNRYEYTENKE